MTQNLPIASEPDERAENAASAERIQDARSLIDHLSSSLSIGSKGQQLSHGGVLSETDQSAQEASFGKAIMRQAEQIQYLIAQIDRMDSEAELAKLREVVVDLYRALTDVTMQARQNASSMTGKVSLLMEAMTIIGGASDTMNAPDDIALILAAARAASERLGSLERLSTKTGASIIGLDDRVSSGQNKIQDLSADVAKLNENIESERKEIGRSHQRIDAADQALTQGLAALGRDVKADRSEIAGLHQRIDLSDQAFAQGLTALSEDIKAGRDEIAGFHQRVGTIDKALTQGLAKLGECVTTARDDLEQLNERLVWVEKSAALHAAFEKKIGILTRRLEEMELNSAAEIKSWWLQESERNAALINRLESLEQKNHSLIHAIEQMAGRQNAAEQTIATMIQRQKAQSALHDRVAHLLLARPESSV